MKKISIYVKHNDLAGFEAIENDKVILSKDGYLPTEFLNITSSDETEFEIDVETGKILNWDKDLALKAFEKGAKFDGEDEDYYDKDYDESNGVLHGISNLNEKNRLYNEAKDNASKEDNVYYQDAFKNHQELIKTYKSKFSAKLDTEGIIIYKPNTTSYDSSFFGAYTILNTAIVLFDNGINCELKNDGIYVSLNDSEIAREILKEIGAYKFKYCRRDEDANLI